MWLSRDKYDFLTARLDSLEACVATLKQSRAFTSETEIAIRPTLANCLTVHRVPIAQVMSLLLKKLNFQLEYKASEEATAVLSDGIKNNK